MLTTPKLKELQGPKVGLIQPLLAATIPPNPMSFHWTVMKKCRQHISQHTCMHDDLYHACKYAWDKVKHLLHQNSRSYRGQNLDVSSYYWLQQPHQILLCSVAWFRRNDMKIFPHTSTRTIIHNRGFLSPDFSCGLTEVHSEYCVCQHSPSCHYIIMT